MSFGASRPRLLLVGGGGGLVGRAVLKEFRETFAIRSLHRHAIPTESGTLIEWIPGDVGDFPDWPIALRDVDVVLNVAWYRSGSRRRFERLYEGLSRLLEAARRSSIRTFLQVSVPEAPSGLELRLPYLTFKRRFDRALAESGLSYSIVRPTLLFGRNDRLLSVMLRMMHRYHRFPMFGDGEFHLSPVSSTDLASVLSMGARTPFNGTLDMGGPVRYRYRDLTDLMFQVLGLPPRYIRLKPRASVATARMLVALGSKVIYAYEVKWLLSDRLGLPPYSGLDRPMERCEPYLRDEAERLRAGG